MDFVENEGLLRIGFFLGGLGLFWLTGLLFAYRRKDESQKGRWLNNLGLTVVNTLILRLLLPTGLVAVASFAESNQFGVFNFFPIPLIVDIVLSFFIFDCVIYYQHVVFHRVRFLWRLHQVHHSDTGFDATTALRFHPLEILISTLIKAIVICLLGVSAEGVIVFEILLNFSALFNHSNFSLPASIETRLRSIVVTPDMHRIHHSIRPEETNSNFGFFLSWWDRIFKTYRPHSSENLKFSPIGVEKFREGNEQQLDKLLTQPFR